MKKTKKSSTHVSLNVKLPLPQGKSMPAAALGMSLAGAAYAIRRGESVPKECQGAAIDALGALHAALDKKGRRRTAANQLAFLAEQYHRRADGAITIKQAINRAIKFAHHRPDNKHTFDSVRQALRRLRADRRAAAKL